MNYGVYPLRPWEDFYLTSGGYLSEEYRSKYGKWHRGEDANRKTGGDTDLGYPIQSMFPGKVLYAATPENSGWGGLVLIRTEEWLKNRIAAKLGIELDVLDIQYAHLQHITVKVGMYLNPGNHIGTIGKGGYGQYYAHLHLEARKKELSAYEPQGSDEVAKEKVREYTIDPKLILGLPLADFESYPSADRLEISGGKLYVNDKLEATGLIVARRVENKLFVKSEI